MTVASEDATCADGFDDAPEPLRELLSQAEELAAEAERLLAKSDAYLKRLRLEAMLVAREAVLFRNAENERGDDVDES